MPNSTVCWAARRVCRCRPTGRPAAGRGQGQPDGAALDANAAGRLERTPPGLQGRLERRRAAPARRPVEITGEKVKGNGGVTGTLTAPRLDLVADLEQIDVPRLPLKDAKLALTFQRQADGSTGAVALTASSAYGPAVADPTSAFRAAAST